MLKNIKAVLFDLDGTLVDSMGVWYDIDIAFCNKYNIDMPENLQSQIDGLSMTETAVFFQDVFHLDMTIDEMKSIWIQMASDAYRNHIPLKNGVLEYLEYLKSQDIKMAVATSNAPELVQDCFEGTGLENYIDLFVTANEVPKGKPAPDVFLEAARRLEVSPDQCLVFEDVIPGIQAGKNAGMRVCAVYDSHTKDLTAEKKAEADFYIQDFTELL